MIEIIKRNGVTETWDKDQYDDYMYDGKCFVIIKKSMDRNLQHGLCFFYNGW